MTKDRLQPAYILHTRAYRDTSLLLELFTEEHGRVSAVARGAKGPRSRFKGLLQPFVPLLVSWTGKTDLMTLVTAEPNGMLAGLNGDTLACGFYLNELLIHLLHRYDAHPQLYQAYHQALVALQQKKNQQIILRIFEKQLLSELGYALQFDREAHTGTLIAADQFYYFDPSQGLSFCEQNTMNAYNVFGGESLLALHTGEFSNEDYLRDAKRLLRLALGRLLGNKLIRSRELFI